MTAWTWTPASYRTRTGTPTRRARARGVVTALLAVALVLPATGVQAQSSGARPAAPADARPTAPVDGFAEAAAAARVADDGRARVVVQLAVEFDPTAVGADAADARAHAAEIRRDARRVEDELRGTGHGVLRRYDRVPALALEVSPAAIARLRASDAVADVELDTMSAPTLEDSGALLGAGTINASGLTGTGQAVAILDTGVDTSHPFLGGRVVAEACFASGGGTGHCPGGGTTAIGPGSAVPCAVSGCSHGTHVAGIAAGGGADSSGVAPQAPIIAIQVFSTIWDDDACGGSAPCPLAYGSDLLAALDHVLTLSDTMPVAAANLSLGGGLYTSACDSTSLKGRVDALAARGIATVISSGNSGSSTGVGWPGCISSAVTVGSTTTADVLSGFSNSNSLVDLLAPGSSIRSSVPGAAYGTMSGTSMAAPQVTGAWSVARQARPSATVTQVQSLLAGTGVAVHDARNDVTRSRISLLGALGPELATCPADPQEPDDTRTTASGLPAGVGRTAIRCAGDTDVFRVPGLAGGTVALRLDVGTAGADLDLRLVDADGALLADSTAAPGGRTLSYTTPGEAAVYAVVGASTDGATAGYTLRARGDVCPPEEAAEPNDSVAGAAPLPLGGGVHGATCAGTTAARDHWSFHATAGEQLELELHHDEARGPLWLGLYGPGGGTPLVWGGTDRDLRRTATVPAPVTGTYTAVAIANSSVSHPYWLQVTGASALALPSEPEPEPEPSPSPSPSPTSDPSPSPSPSPTSDPSPSPTPTSDPSPTPTPTREPKPEPAPTGPATVDRLAGTDRISTSVAISADTFDRADTVVLARADTYPDALAGAPLAARLGGPILLTGQGSLSDAARSEIARLRATRVVLLGGQGALSPQVEGQVAAMGVSVERIAGQDRFDTARRIALAVGGTSVYVTEGVNADPRRGWPDAVAVSALAAFQQRPILLATRDELPTASARALDELGVTAATVVGGTGAVADHVETQIARHGVRVERVSGTDRFDTSRRVVELAQRAGMSAQLPWLATGLNYPDALVAGPAVARAGGVLLLVHGDSLELSTAGHDWVQSHAGTFRRTVVVGGAGVVSDLVEGQLRTATTAAP